jgi:hypothetical protein
MRNIPDEAKTSVRRGQKAAGLTKMAELPKEEAFGMLGLSIQ